MKKNLNEFEVFEVEKSQLDKVVGGKKIVDRFDSEPGISAFTGCYENPKAYCCVQEFTDVYDDNSWDTWFVPCESRKPGNISTQDPSSYPIDIQGMSVTANFGPRSTNNCTIKS